MMQPRSYIAAWQVDDESHAPPRFTIGKPGFFGRGMELALDPRNKAIIVSDKDLNAVLTFEVSDVFSRGSAE